MSKNQSVIPTDNIELYIKNLGNHMKELNRRNEKVLMRELDEQEAGKQNAESLLAFYDSLVKFLNFCNIRILT